MEDTENVGNNPIYNICLEPWHDGVLIDELADLDFPQLPPQSHLPVPVKTRMRSPIRDHQGVEASASSISNRNALMPLAQQGHTSRKHALSDCPEPLPKRQTLVEKAAASSRANPAAPASNRPVNAAVQAAITSHSTRFNSSTGSSLRPTASSTLATVTVTTAKSKPISSSIPSKIPSPRARGRSPASPRTHRSAISFSASVGPGVKPIAGQSISSSRVPMPPCRSGGTRRLNQGAPLTNGMPTISLFTSLPPPGPHWNTRRRPTNDNRVLPSRPKVLGPDAAQSSIAGHREVSLSSAMRALSLGSSLCACRTASDESPSRIPKPNTPAIVLPPEPLFLPKSRRKSPTKIVPFLTKESVNRAWNIEEEYNTLENNYIEIRQTLEGTIDDVARNQQTNQQTIAAYQNLLENANQSHGALCARYDALDLKFSAERDELNTTRARLAEIEAQSVVDARTAADLQTQLEARDGEIQQWATWYEQEQVHGKQQLEFQIEQLKHDGAKQIEDLRAAHAQESQTAQKTHETELQQALAQASSQGDLERQQLLMQVAAKEQEGRSLAAEVDRQKVQMDEMMSKYVNATQTIADLVNTRVALLAKIEFLESGSKQQSTLYAKMEKERDDAFEEAKEAKAKFLVVDTERRKLHNEVQDLKGNIRVMGRVRAVLTGDGSPRKHAQMTYPNPEDAREIAVRGPEEKSSLGKDVTKVHPFAFDRIFGPSATNSEIFGEVSQLIQSVLDGFNVCIFAYGQTGSGKTYTMSSDDGMIPQAIRMIYSQTKDLEEHGWTYSIQGAFVEIYNEDINDLLGKHDGEKANRHEIKHDMQHLETTVTNITNVELDTQDQVERVLARAMANRSVAATQANERSSRSHSVFMLTLKGENALTGERCKGTLNLVDLAGSERLTQSKAEGARLRETQNINRSLSCLGDVIAAIGQGKEGTHIPYRNSKLTNLLQFSLGGNSKTLMFVMVSPSRAHLSETLTSLKFATKVHSTHIGTAKKQK